MAVWGLVRNAAAPLVECIPPGSTCCLFRPAQGFICWRWVALTAGSWTDLKAPSQLGFGLFGNSSLCWGSSPVCLVSPFGFTCRPYVLQHVQWDLDLHHAGFCTSLHSKLLLHHRGAEASSGQQVL